MVVLFSGYSCTRDEVANDRKFGLIAGKEMVS